MKKQLNIETTINNKLRDALNTMIRNISAIAIFISVAVVLVLYLGPEITLTSALIFRLAVPSIIVAISTTMLYELWIQNGRRTAYEEQDYIDLLKNYAKKSDGLYYPNVQAFLDYEEKRRFTVAEERLTNMIDRDISLIEKIKNTTDKTIWDKVRIKQLKSPAKVNLSPYI